MDELAKSAIPIGITLRGGLKGFCRCRVGDYRIIYKIEGQTIKVRRIRHRKDIYKKTKVKK